MAQHRFNPSLSLVLIFQSATLRSLPPFFVTHLLTVARKNTQLDSHVSLSLAVSLSLPRTRTHAPFKIFICDTSKAPSFFFFSFFVVSTCIFQRKHWRGQTQAKPHYNYIYIYTYIFQLYCIKARDSEMEHLFVNMWRKNKALLSSRSHMNHRKAVKGFHFFCLRKNQPRARRCCMCVRSDMA